MVKEHEDFFARYLKGVYIFWARWYDGFVDCIFRFDRDRVVKKLRLKKNEKVLEVGVGTGLNLPFYPASCTVTGVDFSFAMVKKAREKKRKAKILLQVADARSLPFQVDRFDKALASYVLRVSPDPQKILQEVSRVTKKNSLLVIVDQFEMKKSLCSMLTLPIKLVLGWGKDHPLKKLIKNTSWEIESDEQFGAMVNTRLVVLKNKKG